MFVSTQSSSIAVSSSPSWSVQLWNFSAIQAASPAGESVRRTRAFAAWCPGCGCSRSPSFASGVALWSSRCSSVSSAGNGRSWRTGRSLEAAGEESAALPGDTGATIEALARLPGLRRAAGPQAGQRLEAEVIEDLDLPAQLDELGERALDRRRGRLRQVKERRRRSIRRYRFPGPSSDDFELAGADADCCSRTKPAAGSSVPVVS